MNDSILMQVMKSWGNLDRNITNLFFGHIFIFF